MAIHLITDFGLEGPYTGQVFACLQREAPSVPAFSLFADVPVFDVWHGAYLVAAYGRGAAEGDVLLCVIDPGVGSERDGMVLLADKRWYVGPDNGLLQIAARHAEDASWWRLPPPPADGPQTFHGRDWFAPAAARIAQSGAPADWLRATPKTGGDWPPDLAEIVYIDRYGNAMTGLRGCMLDGSAKLRVSKITVGSGTVYAASDTGVPFWYVNANGLVEIAVNRGRADVVLRLAVGSAVEVL